MKPTCGVKEEGTSTRKTGSTQDRGVKEEGTSTRKTGSTQDRGSEDDDMDNHACSLVV
uniref:Uncharacterized protein n=1 Tax=Helianthus annuus TaxID=4232 RepID=A0A251T867_HELAN